MGIFERINKTKNHPRNSTKGFYFGETEAEGENVKGSSLLDYFDDYLNILEQLKVGKYIFTGRKGVGKSAIAKFIKDTADETDDSFAKILRISDFELEKTIQNFEQNSNKEKLIFEWLILVNVVKLIISNECGQYTNEYSKLKKFLDTNAGIVNIDKYEVVAGEKNKGGEASFGVLKHIFGGVFKNYFKTNVNKAPFYKLIPPLKDILKIILDYPVNKELEFWLLFDDLDINYNVKNEKDNEKVMELIRISKEYNNEIFKNNNAKILIFIRDDMRDNLKTKYADSAKIFNAYEVFINWFSTTNDENKIPLKQLADKRIEINFKKHNISFKGNPWDFLFENDYYNGKTSFKYILDFTFYRPRDIITFLNSMTNINCEYPITKRIVKTLLKNYINTNITEIKSELNLFFSISEIEKIFNTLFPYIIQNIYLKTETILDKINQIGFDTDAENVLNLLRKYSLIIVKDANDKIYFNYRENTELEGVDRSELYYTLPKCIYHNYRTIN